jgi:hypothetical protein
MPELGVRPDIRAQNYRLLITEYQQITISEECV